MSWLNRTINSLPVELHIPGYQFCGPGTKLKKRLARGDQGVNDLDRACREHDIAYSKDKEVADRNRADLRLADKAWERATASDSTAGERLAAWGVTNAMKAKVKLGMGHGKRKASKRKIKMKKMKTSFKSFIAKAKKAVRLIKPPNMTKALAAAMKSYGSLKRSVTLPRVIPINHTGGILPLIPIFAGLSALGALSGGAASIATAVNRANAARKELAESSRHNKTMEAIAIGKGAYLKPYKKGMGLFLKPHNNASKN